MDVSRLEAGIIVNGLSFINVGSDIDAKNCRIKLSKVSRNWNQESIRQRQLFFYVFIILFIQAPFSIRTGTGRLRHVRWKISLQRRLESGNGCALQRGRALAAVNLGNGRECRCLTRAWKRGPKSQ